MIYHLAGACAVAPGPLTLRELVLMSDGRDRQLWVHTSFVLAMLANVHRDPKKGRAMRPADFNPYADADARRRGIPVTADNIEVLKRLM